MDAPATDPPTPPLPFAAAELRPSLRQLDTILDVVLGAPARLGANIALGQALRGALGLLLLVSAIAALPFGLVVGTTRALDVTALYLGSTLICFPSLHVFACYLGLRVRLAQSLSLALTIPAVAAVFSCGLAPIYGFLKFTLQADPAVALDLRGVLLCLCLATGVAQLWRCGHAVHLQTRTRGGESAVPFVKLLLLFAWHLVFLYVCWRMAVTLHLDG